MGASYATGISVKAFLVSLCINLMNYIPFGADVVPASPVHHLCAVFTNPNTSYEIDRSSSNITSVATFFLRMQLQDQFFQLSDFIP